MSPFLTGAMLQRMRVLGPHAMANARYGIDFLPVRERSIGQGSLYICKEVEEDVIVGSSRRTGAFDYSGHIFGEIDAVFEEGTGPRIYVRLKCPRNATCAVRILYMRQLEVLWSALDSDCTDAVINSSWFDHTKVHEGMAAVENRFYVSVKGTGSWGNCWTIGADRVFRANLCRYDEDHGAVSYRDYWLDVVGFTVHNSNYVPRADPPEYVCDVNGRIGCSFCTAATC
ncbi:hypothetical protein C8R43DRAFT_1129284 [Mycena crocata]|nr:hypothetical protein C8R43DRAFT_1129284 [Mycena crocata]